MESRRKITPEMNMGEPVKVRPVTKKITEKRLKWYGHVKRKE